MTTGSGDHGDQEQTDADRGRFGLFLTILTTAFIVSGFGGKAASAIGLLLSALLAVVAFRNARMLRDTRWLTALCTVSVGSTVALLLMDGDSTWRAVPMLLQAAMLTVLVVGTVMTALGRSVVDLQTILAAISAYVLIGFVYAWTYLAIAVIDDDQFSMPSSDPTQFFEFSFVVQTTLGFGDQLPTEPFSSRIVVTQAVIGQMFLATLVARLVSLYGRPGARARRQDEA